jgi:hypothetical protein
MIYCFDIDGTLCSNTNGDYLNAVPDPQVIALVRQLVDEGHEVLLYTARGSTTGIDWREATERQLREWGIRHHGLFMGKPTADVYVDDKAVNVADWKRQALGGTPPATTPQATGGRR